MTMKLVPSLNVAYANTAQNLGVYNVPNVVHLDTYHCLRWQWLISYLLHLFIKIMYTENSVMILIYSCVFNCNLSSLGNLSVVFIHWIIISVASTVWLLGFHVFDLSCENSVVWPPDVSNSMSLRWVMKLIHLQRQVRCMQHYTIVDFGFRSTSGFMDPT